MDAQCDQGQRAELLGEYERTKSALNEVAIELRTLALRAGDEGVADATEALFNELRKERLYLAVLGNFKRGKSTFINALIGSPVLPTGVVPLTSVVTILSYGDGSSAVVHYKSGGCSTVGIDELADYITEQGNPRNGKGIAEVEVSIESPYLRSGVVLVDTPGIGSTYGDNTRTTIEFLSRLDAAIVLIGSDPPVSQEELDFIKEVRRFVRSIYIVQNKIDRLNGGEWKEALAFSRSVIRDALGDYVDIYPISSKMGLEAKLACDPMLLEESGLSSFQAELERFIAVEKGRVLLDSFIAKMQREMSRLQAILDLERKVLCDEGERLDGKVRWLKSETEAVDRRMDEVGYLIDGGVERIVSSMDDELVALKRENRSLIQADLLEHLDKLDPGLGPREFTEAVEARLSESIVHAYSPFLEKEESSVSLAFISLIRRYEKEVNSIEEQLKNEVSTTFGIEIRSYPASSLNIGASEFRFDRTELLNYRSILPAELPFLLPKPLFRRAMKKKAMAMVETELDKHGGKIRYDVSYRLSENARRAKDELRTRLSSSADAMKKAVQAGISLRAQSEEERMQRTSEISDLRKRADMLWAQVTHLQQDLRSPL